MTMKPPVLLLFSCLIALVTAQVNPFWGLSGYPSCTQTCLQNIYTTQQCSLSNNCRSSCFTPCICLVHGCLCETPSWLIAVAQCIGKTCSTDNVTIAASIAESVCTGQGYKLAVASSAFVSYGIAAAPTSASSLNPTSKFRLLLLEKDGSRFG
jgi:hypothetical protein